MLSGFWPRDISRAAPVTRRKKKRLASSRGPLGLRDLACSAETFWGCAMVRLKLITPTRCQIIPFWVEAHDQGNLLVPRPPLNLLLPLDGSSREVEEFVIDQPRKVIVGRESGQHFILVLEHAPRQLSGDARIQHVRVRPVGHDVDVEMFCSAHNA